MSMRQLISALLLMFLACPVQAQEEEPEGGIIGTGIVGTITDLGSIYVNGQHIQIEPNLPVSGAITARTAADLRPGHVVAVTAYPEGADWRADSIWQVLPLVGPVEAVAGDSLVVLGTRVRRGTTMPTPALGEWVAVSGLWQAQTLVASRIDPVPPADQRARISGSYFGPDAQGRDVIGTTTLSGIKTQHLGPGDLVRVFGQPVPGGIKATRVERHLFTAPVNIVQAEGYLSRPLPDGLYTLLGSGLVSYTAQPEMIEQQTSTILCGNDGKIDTPEARRDAARALRQRLNCAP